MSNESDNYETACTFTPPSAHRLALSHSTVRPPPPPFPTIVDGVALAFPLAGPMGTRLHAAVTALIQHQQHPYNHLWDVVLKATSQRLTGSHRAQRGFFVAVAKDSPELTLVIESVIRLLCYVKSTSGCSVNIARPLSILVQISNLGKIPSPFCYCGDSMSSETMRATTVKSPLPQRCAYR